ncbi:MAG: hypothetical protein ACQEP1_05000 [Nanobdellota archaeon]
MDKDLKEMALEHARTNLHIEEKEGPITTLSGYSFEGRSQGKYVSLEIITDPDIRNFTEREHVNIERGVHSAYLLPRSVNDEESPYLRNFVLDDIFGDVWNKYPIFIFDDCKRLTALERMLWEEKGIVEYFNPKRSGIEVFTFEEYGEYVIIPEYDKRFVESIIEKKWPESSEFKDWQEGLKREVMRSTLFDYLHGEFTLVPRKGYDSLILPDQKP